MNALDPINFTIEFVKQQVDPGGGGITPVAQTGDIAIWAILAILFVGVIAYCMFKFSRAFNGQYVFATTTAKHAKNARGGGRIATTKAVLIAAVVGLIACLSITTTTAFAQSQKSAVEFKPDKIQVIINEETGEAFCDAFEFVNNTNDYYLFTNSTLSLTDAAAEVSSEEDWDVTLNAPGLNALLFSGKPGDFTIDYDSVKVLNPGGTSNAIFTFNDFDKEIAKQLIGKQVFNLSLSPAQNIVKVPAAETGLVYDGSEKVGVKGGSGYTLTGNTGTNAGDNYVATATLYTADLIWPDKTKAPKEILWSIRKADGSFDTYPTAKSLTYSGLEQELVDAGDSGYEATVVYKIEGGEYSTNIPVATDAKNYVVYAQVKEDANHFPSAEYPVENVRIDQNVLKSITIQGLLGNKEYSTTGEYYTFPNYGQGDTAYDVSDYELAQQSPKESLVKAEYVSPLNNTTREHGGIDPIIVPASDKGSHPLVLNSGYTWSYNDPNIKTNDQTEWIIHNGNLQINEDKYVTISVVATPEKVRIKDTVTYKVTLNNKTDKAISGGVLQINADGQKIEGIDLPNKEPVTKDMTYEVKASDFLYPSLINTITFSADIEGVPYKYIIYDSVSTTFEYIEVTAPVVTDSYYNGDEYKPFPVVHEGYEIIVGDGSVDKATDAGNYTTLIVLQPGYKWSDSSTSIYKLIRWNIKPIDVLIHFDVADTGYTTTYGNSWKVPANAFTYKASQPLPAITPTLKDILGPEDPTSDCSYNQGDFAGEYTVSLNLPPKSGWNSNYSISSKNTKLTVGKATLDLTWQTSATYTGKPQYPNITYTGQYGQDEISFKVVAYSDSQHTQETSPVDPGTYYCTATIEGSINQRNYAIKTDKDKATFTINESPTDITPKAVLTGPTIIDPNYTLNFVYDDITYTEGEGGVIKVYPVNHTALLSSLDESTFPAWHESNEVLNLTTKAIFQPSFDSCRVLADFTRFGNLDLWFADMPNIVKVEGFDNVHLDSGFFGEEATARGVFFRAGSADKIINFSEFKDINNVISNSMAMFRFSKYKTIILPSDKNAFSSITNASYMFDSCTNLVNIINDDFVTDSNKFNFAVNMYSNCTELLALNICNLNIKKNNPDAKFDNMFSGCSKLEKISCNCGTNWYDGFMGSSQDMFAGCDNLPHYTDIVGADSPDIKFAIGCNSTNWQSIKGLFSEPEFKQNDGKCTIDSNGKLCFYVKGETVPANEEWDVPKDGTNVPWTSSETRRNSIKEINASDNFKIWLSQYVTSTKAWFKQLNNVKVIDVSNWNTKLVTDMSEMFAECSTLTFVNVSGMDTSAVQNMSKMFNDCKCLSSIDGIENINVSNATNISYIFYNCNLRGFDGTQWNVSNVEDFSFMFCGNTGITSLSLNNWNVSNGITFNSMFYSCRALVSLNIKSFDLSSKAETVEYMFWGCYSLRNIFCNDDWRSLNIHDPSLFEGCYQLPGYDSMQVGKGKAYQGSGGYFI